MFAQSMKAASSTNCQFGSTLLLSGVSSGSAAAASCCSSTYAVLEIGQAMHRECYELLMLLTVPCKLAADSVVGLSIKP
jgi:hypothetical protein